MMSAGDEQIVLLNKREETARSEWDGEEKRERGKGAGRKSGQVMLFVSCCLPRAKIMVDLGRRPCLINTTMQFHPIRMGRGPSPPACHPRS